MILLNNLYVIIAFEMFFPSIASCYTYDHILQYYAVVELLLKQHT